MRYSSLMNGMKVSDGNVIYTISTGHNGKLMFDQHGSGKKVTVAVAKTLYMIEV